MKVKDLIKYLEQEDLDSEVIISGDPEGNDFRTIDMVDNSRSGSEGVTNYTIIIPTDTLVEPY
jgi:hypothetical protein